MVADCFGDGGDGPSELFEWFGGDHAAVYAAVWISVCFGSVALWGCGDGGIVSGVRTVLGLVLMEDSVKLERDASGAASASMI